VFQEACIGGSEDENGLITFYDKAVLVFSSIISQQSFILTPKQTSSQGMMLIMSIN